MNAMKETRVSVGGKEMLKVPNNEDVVVVGRIQTQGGRRKDRDNIADGAEAVGVLPRTNLLGRNIVMGAPRQKKVEWGGRGDGNAAATML
jgi:hypothetical protein